jgi:acetyl esterase/lipase
MPETSEPRRRSRALSHARWIARARPGDYLLAATRVSAGLPVIGRHLEPLGGFLALGLFAPGFAPGLLATTGRPNLPGGAADRQRIRYDDTVAAVTAGLADVATPDVRWPEPTNVAPVLNSSAQRVRVLHTSVPYGGQPGQVLDVWRRADLTTAPAPVLIFVPGGAWVFGSRKVQGHTLMAHLAEQGWVCLSLEYRTSPKHRWPRQLIDVKTAIAWARANVGRFGGDANFVAIAGCSAGGHLATLAGLTPHDHCPELPAGADTSVDAVVSIYGSYDWEDRSTPERARFMSFLERVVVQRRQRSRPETFRAASPMARLSADAPPVLVIHGTKDFLIPVSEAETFAERLAAVSRSRVSYIAVPGGTHGFDLIDGTRTGPVVNAVGLFLSHVHRAHRPPVFRAV